MSFNGSGTFLINTAGQPVVSGTVISSTAFNALTADLATGLSTAITKDGQTTVTANIPMSTYKFTGLGVGSAATDSANLSQVQSTVTKLLNSVSGADTITATASPTLAAYAAGQMFYFVAAGDNTTSVTLNIDSLGAKAVTRDGSTALVAADIKSGEVIVVVYDGTRFQVVSQLNSAGNATFANVSITSALNVGGVATLSGNLVFNSTAQRLTADMSNGTVSNRFAFQTSTTNGNTQVNAIPNGTSTTAQFIAYNNADSNNASSIQIAALSTATRLLSGQTGTGTYLPLTFFTSGSEQARLDTSGNFGIGTASPGYKLTVQSAIDTYAFNIRDTIGNERVLIGSRATAPIDNITPVQMGNDNTGNLFLSSRTNSASGINFYTNAGTAAALRATIDSSGNLGLGVTPSAWGSNYRAFQFGYGGNIIAGNGTFPSFVSIGANYYLDSTPTARYLQNGESSLYQQNGSAHQWFTAPSGTAGNAISFTQAMTLDASGNLLVGDTTSGYGTSGRVTAELNASTSVLYALRTANTNRGYLFANSSTLAIEAESTCDIKINAIGSKIIQLLTNNTERARITSGGDLLVGTTTSKGKITVQGQLAVGQTAAASNATGIYLYASDTLSDNSYLSRGSSGSGTTTWYIGNQTITTSSDSRLKANIKPTERNALELLNQWEIVDHTWNDPSDQCENNRNSRGVWTGVVAQQVQPITPWLVNKPLEEVNEDGTINPWTMDFGYAVPLLVKAIQEQQSMINELKAKVTALESK